MPHSSPPNRPEPGAHALVLVFGSKGKASAWTRDDGEVLQFGAEFSDATAELVKSHLSSTFVGLRLVLVGSEATVYAVRAVAISCGLIPEEISTAVLDLERSSEESETVWADPNTERRVFCGHCHVTMTAKANVGDAIRCIGCNLNLVVRYHFSRRYAAYLGSLIRL
ncbi:dimethylamine monooxygenase subunit DmmA family protein [Paenarthrobacter ureafaciens]|uniref:dimethylamine monooxygenase subunit DmmA family protein n=1 Tax=Paenarthrobacter ureafaciens TaxID=37931 RepID=UPI001C2C73BB